MPPRLLDVSRNLHQAIFQIVSKLDRTARIVSERLIGQGASWLVQISCDTRRRANRDDRSASMREPRRDMDNALSDPDLKEIARGALCSN
jgi:hypothetical protein